MLGLPGSAYLYQGQELALPEELDLPDELRQDPAFISSNGKQGFRDGCRVPFPWTTQPPSLGFSSSPHTWLPIPAAWGSLSVEAQTGNPASTLELTRTALGIRRREDALGDGPVRWEPAESRDLLVLRREDPAGDILVAMNLGENPAELPGGQLLVASDDLAATTAGWLIPPDAAAWIRAR
ncbi:MAG: DUF3459 domain-containing protein [Candidatus Nanopelagicales bacterium]